MRLFPLISCGEIRTDFGVETFKQFLFHRNFQKGMKKAGAPGGVLAFVTGGDVIRVPWN